MLKNAKVQRRKTCLPTDDPKCFMQDNLVWIKLIHYLLYSTFSVRQLGWIKWYPYFKDERLY